MRKCSNIELEKIYAGTTISSSIVNAFTNIIKVLLSAGHELGSGLRRIGEGTLCPLE